MEKPKGFSDVVASSSIKRISSFFICIGFESVTTVTIPGMSVAILARWHHHLVDDDLLTNIFT